MSWNLKAHLLDHSAATHNKLGTKRTFNENNSQNQHFTFSLDISSLIVNHGCRNYKDIHKVMTNFMDDLVSFNSEPYRESKGRHKKTGEKVYRNVEFNFNDALLVYHSEAAHKSNSNYSVNPHFHALFHQSQKIGSTFKYLREAIDTVSKTHNIVFNFQEETCKPKIDSKVATDLTWFVKRSSDKDFRRRVEDGWVKRALIDFQNHYKQTGNLMYLLKGYRDLEMRCKSLKISHDMEFSLFLTDEQKSTIQVLYSGDKKKIIHLINDRQNHIARGYLEHSYGFSNIIIDEIQKRSGIQMPIFQIDPSELNIEIKRKVKKDNSSKFNKTLAYANKSDLLIALKYARNEKELKAIMVKELGYKSFAFKVKNIAGKRQRVGFTYLNSGKTRTVFFNQLKLDMGNLRAVLMANSKNPSLDVPKDLKSYLKSYEPLPQISYPDKLFEEIYNLKSTLSLKGFYVKQLDSNAVEFKAKKTYILDQGNNRILVKAHQKEDLERNVKLIADMVESKGIHKYNISGSETFKLAMKAELTRREKNRSLQVNQVLLSEDSMYALEKVYDDEKAEELQLPTEDDVLKELSDMHLSKISIDDSPEAYKKLFSIRAKALINKDLSILLQTYDVLPPIDNLEMREKLLSLAKCLNISSGQIFLDIGSDIGFQEHEIEAFKDVITESDDYGKTFLRKFINQLEEQLRQALVLDESLSNNQLERHIALLESLLIEINEFQNSYLSKQEYVQKIEDINTAISSNSFYEAQLLINGLDDEIDKKIYEKEYQNKIDVVAAELDFQKLKDYVEAEMNKVVSYETEDDLNHQPTLN